jgi:hypothetical protein
VRRRVKEGEGEERPLRPARWAQVRANRGLLQGARHVNEVSQSKKEEEIGLESTNGGDQLAVLHIQDEHHPATQRVARRPER